MSTVDHIGILVHSVDASIGYYRDQLRLTLVSDETLPHLAVRLAYFDAGGVMLQLIEPTGDGPLMEHITRFGECLHHVCFGVDDIEAAIDRLSPDIPVTINNGGRGRRSAFLPRSPNGLRTELTEYEPRAHG